MSNEIVVGPRRAFDDKGSAGTVHRADLPKSVTQPVVSVVIPTYNHASYVLDTLGSVFAQTFADFEVIVVNDGSPDDTAALLGSLIAEGRIRYFEQANAGQATARNRGLAESRGEFIAYLDDDDLWPPDKLAWQVAALRDHPEWVMVSGLRGLLESDGSIKQPDGADGAASIQTAEAMFEGNGIESPGQVLIRRTALDAVGGFDTKLWGSDDTDLWMRLAAHGTTAQVARTALYYRIHATNASHAVGRMFWNSVRMVRKNLSLLPRHHRKRAWQSALQCIYVYSGTRVVKAAYHGGWRARWSALLVLVYLLPTTLRDATLARMVGSDLEPTWLRTLRHRGKPMPAK